MSALMQTLRAIVRAELARIHAPELGEVTAIHTKDGDGSKNNHQVNVKLRSSGLELERVQVAVGRLGLSCLPQVGDLMLIAFVGGDLNAPVALGCVYDDQANPPVAQEHEVVYMPPDDEDSAVKRIHIELKSGTKLTLEDEKLTVELGDSSMIIEKDGDVTIKAKGKITLESDSDVEIKGGGDVKLEATGTLKGKGSSAEIEGSSSAKLKGGSVTLAGNTSFSAS
jgi:phage baseplate assembly protein gpV